MIRIGITGIIGSGKSVVCKILEILEIPVYNADNNAKLLMNHNNIIKQSLISYFGVEVYSDNKLNKIFLSKQIFNSETNRKYVNSVIHPIVIDDFIKWSEKQNKKIVAIESALLFEAEINKIIDYVILVETPEEMLLQRIMKRDGIPEEEAIKRIKSQIGNKLKFGKSNFFILNDEDNSLIEQALGILRKIKNNGKNR